MVDKGVLSARHLHCLAIRSSSAQHPSPNKPFRCIQHTHIQSANTSLPMSIMLPSMLATGIGRPFQRAVHYTTSAINLFPVRHASNRPCPTCPTP